MNACVKNSYQLLPPLKRAALFQEHIIREKLTKTKIALRYGKSLSYISNTIRLLKLPEIVKEGLESSQISEGHARALAAIDDSTLMVEAYKIILRESGSGWDKDC